MEKVIFDYIDQQLGNEIGVSITYEYAEINYSLEAESFKEIVKEYSWYYGYKYNFTKDDIGFIKIDRISKTKN